MTNDMTKGNPLKLIITFSIPLFIGNLFQQLYSIIDTLIVGRTIDVKALAAVGATGAISFLIIGFVIGFTAGFAVVTAQFFGAGDYDGVRRSVTSAIMLSAVFTVIVTLLSALSAMPLLKLMDTPQDIINDSYSYIIIIFWGIFASVFYNLLASTIRALGDSRTPLIFLIIASILNIILDFTLILNFKMGVAGAAWATVISQLVSGLLCLVYVSKKFPILKLKKNDWQLDVEIAKNQLKIGLPMAFQFSVTAIGVMVLQSALNSFGSITVAAYTTAVKIEQIATQVFPALGTTMATYSAQNYGAGEYARIRQGVAKASLIALVMSIIGGLAVFFLGENIAELFVGTDQPEVIKQANVYLHLISFFFFVLGMLFIFRNTLQGIGKSTMPFLAGVTELFMRIVAALILSKIFGYFGVCLASPIAWIGATLLLTVSYFYMRKQGMFNSPQNH
ncbi:MAG: MATE family efflux transporter [Oscillospiraceae bacterium]|nr:MATE family efflux transporter [Oscillospiraceae bacterium]